MPPQPSFQSSWTQFFPPNPTFTDKNIPDNLSDRVYIVTGANTGIGEELAQVLYAKHGKVYIACRSEEKAMKAINSMKKSIPHSKGELKFLSLDLADLNKVKSAAERFLAQESTLHILFNNAGVMPGPAKPLSKTAQGHELALGVNCVGTFLFTKLLTPTLASTAARSETANAIRVVWLSSYGLGVFAPESRGIDMSNLDYHIPKPHVERYGISKCGVWLLAVEFARRHSTDDILSVPINPGNVKSALAREQSWGIKWIGYLINHPTIKGVYTELFAAFSSDIAGEQADWTANWVIPWGRLAPLRSDLSKAAKRKEDGGNGNAREFWEWNEKQVEEYL